MIIRVRGKSRLNSGEDRPGDGQTSRTSSRTGPFDTAKHAMKAKSVFERVRKAPTDM
jgi:hypothetical protein